MTPSCQVAFFQSNPTPPLCGAASLIPILVNAYSIHSDATASTADFSSVEIQPSPPLGYNSSRYVSSNSLNPSTLLPFTQARASTSAEFQSSSITMSKCACV